MKKALFFLQIMKAIKARNLLKILMLHWYFSGKKLNGR